MNNNEAVVELRGLSTGYRNKNSVRTVADNLNEKIYSGELTCLLGANGSGKSTLLKTLSAFLEPLSGDVIINGTSLSNYSSRNLARKIGVVLTDRCNIRNMSVRELVGMGRSPYTGFWGNLSKEDNLIVDEAIDFVKISSLRNRMIHTLSDGERQKVMIAKALAQQTPIIFLDEPTAFLDYPSKVEIMQLLYSLSKDADRTIFLSTHDLELALQIADKIWLMKKNKGVVTGTPEDLSLNGSLATFFPETGISFDMYSGLYKIKHNYTMSVTILGEKHSVLYLMMKKALNRINISTSNSEVRDSGIVVTCRDNYFDLSDKSDNNMQFSTIDEVLKYIRQHV